MPTIIYRSDEMGFYESVCRIGLGAQLLMEIPRALRYAVPEPLVMGWYRGERLDGFFAAHDPKGTIGWGLTIKDGYRISAQCKRAEIRDFSTGSASNQQFSMGKAELVRVSSGRIDFHVARTGTTKMPGSERKHVPLWTEEIRVEAAVGKPHPAATAGAAPATLIPVGTAPPRQTQFVVTVKMIHRTTGQPNKWSDVVGAVSQEEAVGLAMMETMSSYPEYALVEVGTRVVVTR